MVTGQAESTYQGRILVVDREDWCREFLSQVVKLLGFPEVRLVASMEEALTVLEETAFDLLITDPRFPEFPHFLDNCQRRFPSMRFILMVHRRATLQSWAFLERVEVVYKPLCLDEMARKIREAIHLTHRFQVEEAIRRWKQEAFRLMT
jgi:DNA-binding NtrC family response regulator